MNIGFKFDSNHVWSVEELKQLTDIIENESFNFCEGETIEITAYTNIINHDFIVIRNDNGRIVLKEDY
jgi:hypothetical protein